MKRLHRLDCLEGMTRTMKRTLCVLLALGVSSAVFAQSTDLATARANLHKNRQATVAANLGLSEGEARTFWPIYREYRMEMARIGDRIVKLVADFEAKYDAMSEADATHFLDEYFSIQSSEISLRKKYVKNFRKSLPPKKVVRFYQIESKLDAALRFELSGLIPLAK